jgi:hypothetical protein
LGDLPGLLPRCGQRTLRGLLDERSDGPRLRDGRDLHRLFPNGGAVDLFDFTVTGDTRPPVCDLTFLYPKEIIRAEVPQMSALAPQFALDLGDHMFVCTESVERANAQMQLYVTRCRASRRPGVAQSLQMPSRT